MKSKDVLIVILLVLLVALAIWLIFQTKLYKTTEKADDLALTLSQVNELADVRSPVIGQINEVLTRNGYSHLKRKVIEKAEND